MSDNRCEIEYVCKDWLFESDCKYKDGKKCIYLDSNRSYILGTDICSNLNAQKECVKNSKKIDINPVPDKSKVIEENRNSSKINFDDLSLTEVTAEEKRILSASLTHGGEK